MENKNLELGGPPNEKYAKFFEKFKEIDTVPIENWNATHILAYFVKKYKEAYGVDYSFKFNSPAPSKCFEVFQVKKLSSLLTAQPRLLKEYIDWVYDTKVVKAKRKLTSISFMVQEDTINFYKINILFAGKKNLNVNRSTALPVEVLDIMKAHNVGANTYGDLAFLSQMTDVPQNLQDALTAIKNTDFDLEILTRIV